MGQKLHMAPKFSISCLHISENSREHFCPVIFGLQKEDRTDRDRGNTKLTRRNSSKVSALKILDVLALTT